MCLDGISVTRKLVRLRVQRPPGVCQREVRECTVLQVKLMWSVKRIMYKMREQQTKQINTMELNSHREAVPAIHISL